MAEVNEEDRTETDVSESEIDSYIISVPELRKKATTTPTRTSKRRKNSQGGQQDVTPPKAWIMASPSSYDTCTPLSAETSNQPNSNVAVTAGVDLSTPRSLSNEAPDTSDLRWYKASFIEKQPVTLASQQKRRGWLGTDGRAWLQGTKSPTRPSRGLMSEISTAKRVDAQGTLKRAFLMSGAEEPASPLPRCNSSELRIQSAASWETLAESGKKF
ncbi:hypothetical protein LTR36_009108 [Oleoguttula mirabilis]|uniref:Uncharacterized protein n=1 Tax=Oleoguttula mirabilis TaxID=1507867 RepID=A0AAV9J785_9PEZI|nr:hypothetical protein LTR36_009108 [Oleoguttula mirabilis]